MKVLPLELKDLGWLVAQDKKCSFSGQGMGAENLCNYLSKDRCFAIKVDEEPKGCLIYWIKTNPDDKTTDAMSIITLFVQEEYRNMGCATLLKKYIENLAKDLGIVIRTRVEETNIKMMNLNKKMGYVIKRIEKDGYATGRNSVFMTKEPS